MMYGIQREKILNEVIFGRGHIVNGPIPTNSWAYNTDIEDYKYNPEKAKQLLADAGWQDSDGDGIIEKDGNKFSLNILVNEENYQRFEITKQVEQDLSNLGIDAKVLVKPWSEVKKLVNTGRYQAATLGWQLKPDPDVTFAFHSKEIKSGFNFVGYSNPKIDELSVKTRRINDITQQRNNLLEIQKIINDDVPYLFLYSKNDLLAVNRKVKGINPGPNGLYYGIESWWISGEEQ
jgi:peptide/nickel transport system substrate-binding protein